jgi:hypothetical protein
VAAGILANPDAVVELTPGADDICAPCIYNVKGVCGDTIDTSYRPKAPPRKQDWNALIDRRWFSRLKLNAGDRLTAREFCARLQAESADLTDIYPEIPADHIRDRARKLLEGIRRFAGLGGSPLAQ